MLTPTTIDSPKDEELDQLEHATPGPWNDATSDSFSPLRQPFALGRGKLPLKASRPPNPKAAAAHSASGSLPVIPSHRPNRLSNNSGADLAIRRRLYPRRRDDSNLLDASTVVNAYNQLLTETESMEKTRAQNMQQRQLHQQALRLGIEQLTPERVHAEQKIIRFQALSNEVDIFQQYLDPFVFEMRTPHEHSVHSSVYRHFTRMQAIQDMGIPIYSLGTYEDDPNDKIILPRTFESFYRRIRRRNAADFSDANLVTKPTPRPPRPRPPQPPQPSA